MSEFPVNVVDELADTLGTIEGVETVYKRPIKPTDAAPCIGVFPVDWMPSDFEIGNPVTAVARYLLHIMVFIKHSNEEEGRALQATLTKNVRLMLERDQDLQVRLSGLTETSMGVTERIQRRGIRTQRFLGNEINGQFLFVSTTEWWFETETT